MTKLQDKVAALFANSMTTDELDEMFDNFTMEMWLEILDSIQNDGDIPTTFGTHQYHDIG